SARWEVEIIQGVVAEIELVFADLELPAPQVIGADLHLGVTPASLHPDLCPPEVTEFLTKSQRAAVTVDPILGRGFAVIVIINNQAAIAGTGRHIIAGLEREGLVELRVDQGLTADGDVVDPLRAEPVEGGKGIVGGDIVVALAVKVLLDIQAKAQVVR